jgi:hypothetical protein
MKVHGIDDLGLINDERMTVNKSRSYLTSPLQCKVLSQVNEINTTVRVTRINTFGNETSAIVSGMIEESDLDTIITVHKREAKEQELVIPHSWLVLVHHFNVAGIFNSVSL